MYIVNITVNTAVAEQQHEALFPQHSAWFKKYFDAGKFLIIGPYTDRARSGVIIAKTESRQELDTILAEDSYYPHLAQYEVNAFTPKMIAAELQRFQV
ncbi:YciI family protein [Dickeya lacustris]|uniref:YciI family protein n=1 Tax=Dickeya lacustris TaxID=2259638 RepID=A0ABY8G5F6_9GAMM|nr:YciI family protein [Dickeya lacustris]WFN55174.1 YciI family protein [Dickeya lacustris]